MRFAMSSLVNSRLAGSQVSFLPRWNAMKAAWHTTWLFAAAAALARGSCRLLIERSRSPDVIHQRETGRLRRAQQRLDVSEASMRVASPVSTQPRSPSMRKLHEPVFRLPSQPSSRITSFTPSAYVQITLVRTGVAPHRLVFHRLRVIQSGGPLAQVHRVRAPFENSASVKIVDSCASRRAHIRNCRGARGRTQPAVPIENLAWRQFFGGQPVAAGNAAAS